LFVSGILAFINCWDVKWATRVQDVFTYAKLLALFIIIFTGAYQLCTGKSVRYRNYIGKIKFRTRYLTRKITYKTRIGNEKYKEIIHLKILMYYKLT